MRHEQHDSDTSETRVTRVLHERHECDTVPHITRLSLGDPKISSKTDPRSSSKRKRKVMLELEIVKQHKQSCHLFEFFILNNKA